MSRLSSALILLENRKKDAASLTSLQLTHRALSDIHVLADFRNLERLDLSSNNLSSLEVPRMGHPFDLSWHWPRVARFAERLGRKVPMEGWELPKVLTIEHDDRSLFFLGLHSCINLKWLCVVQNKLKSLKGVEGLSKLMVLNAGHNQLQSMDGVRSLYLLRALILNDNNITFIGRLDGLQQLNTLVLSRNPINDLGDSLVKLKSITKLSLSNCQVQAIGPSLRFSVNLKEVRLAHNEITTLPAELARNAKIQILDLGGNLISKLRDMEVLFSLTNLKNLNLQGNPIAEKAKLDKKVRKLLPSLQVFNGKPVDKSVKTEISRKDASGDSNDVNHPIEDVAKTEAKASKKLPKENVSGQHKNDEAPSKKFLFDGIGKKSKKQSKKSGKMDHEKSIDNQNQITDLSTVDEALKPVGIDDAEIPFAEVVLSETTRDPPDNSRKKRKHQSAEDAISLSGLVSVPKKKKKTRSSGVNVSTLHILSTTSEVGVGGQSSWDA